MALMEHRASRRTILHGAVVGSGTMALAACSAGEYDGRGVLSRRVKEVPLDPVDPIWLDTPCSPPWCSSRRSSSHAMASMSRWFVGSSSTSTSAGVTSVRARATPGTTDGPTR